MVFQFKLPHDGNGLTSSFVFMLFTYATSFLLITSFWISHHRELTFLKKVDAVALWLNNIALFPITLLPFTTIYHGTFPHARQAALLYLLNYGFVMLGLFLFNQFISFRMGKRPLELSRFNHIRLYLTIICYIPALVFAFFLPWTATFTTLFITIFWAVYTIISQGASSSSSF